MSFNIIISKGDDYIKANKCLNSKTVLQYLILMNNTSYVEVGKKLKITPQQFSDWIKKRRPIPKERLSNLSSYFGIDQKHIVNEKRFTKDINNLNKIDIEIILLKNKIENNLPDTDYYKNKIVKLGKEKDKQIRIARLASIINREDESIYKIIDRFIQLIENEEFDKLGEL